MHCQAFTTRKFIASAAAPGVQLPGAAVPATLPALLLPQPCFLLHPNPPAVDLHCYHSAWMAWLHPLNEAGRQAQPSPEYHIKRALARLQGMKRCVAILH